MNLWLRGHMTTVNKLNVNYIFFCKVYGHRTWQDVDFWWDEGNLAIVWDDPLIMWSFKVTWQIGNLMSPLLQDLWLPNIASWCLIVRETHLQSYMNLWPRVHMWSRDKSKIKFFFSRRRMATKLGRVLKYDEVKLTMTWQDSLFMFSQEVPCKIKKFIFPFL